MKMKLAPVVAVLGTTGLALAAQGDAPLSVKVANVARSFRNTPADVRGMDLQETFANIGVTNASGALVGFMAPDQVGDGLLALSNRIGTTNPAAIRVVLAVSETDSGQVIVLDAAGTPRFLMDGNGGLFSANGDMAEVFPAGGTAVEPGSVMVIDSSRPGSLQPSSQAYDRRVAGIASGANDYEPGITLKAPGASAGQVPVTLSGTVYCLASNVNGPIRAGDLLTTSAVPGHAMRATDPEASRGAVLGKAMEDLKGERGLIMVLASLQ